MGFLIETRDLKTVEDLNNTINNETVNSIQVNVDKDSVMNLSAISSSIELISSLIASLDFRLYKKIDKLKLEEIEQDHRLFLLNKEANYFTNSNTLKKNMVKDMLINGITYVNADRNRNDVKGLYYVDSDNATCMPDTNPIHKDLKVTIKGQEIDLNDFIVCSYNVKDGLTANGILQANKDLLEVALRLQSYFNKNLKAGGGRKGIWKSEKKLGTDEFKQFKQDAKDIKNSDTDIILNNSVNYTPLTNSNRDMQLVENYNLINAQLYNLFGLKENLNEEDFKTFIKTKLNTIVNCIECAVDRTLLLEAEKEQNYMFKLDLDELTEADIKERFEAYKLSLDSGIESINEIRVKENLEPKVGLDLHKMTIGQALYNTTNGEWIIPNLGVTGGGTENEDIKAKDRANKSIDNIKTKTQQDTIQTKEVGNKEEVK
ncbi:phage portal protein [Clostridium cagae]|uniref:phage portal protein n=1 Tax=Clostridium cagae TaxID=2080751 RepID=UPI003F7586BC